MGRRRPVLRPTAVALLVSGVLSGAFAAGRSTLASGRAPDPLRLEHGIPISVVDTRRGALVAADNYLALGISASLDIGQLRQFARAAIDPRARTRFIAASQSFGQGSGPPAGARVVGSVVAHRVESYGAGSARVRAWTLCAYWGPGLVPTQYSALVDVSLRWASDRWWIVAVQESLPGPVAGLVAGPHTARSSEAWDQALAGMSAPYYGGV